MTSAMYRDLAAWLLPTALATDHGPTLVATLIEELRARRIAPPDRATPARNIALASVTTGVWA